MAYALPIPMAIRPDFTFVEMAPAMRAIPIIMAIERGCVAITCAIKANVKACFGRSG